MKLLKISILASLLAFASQAQTFDRTVFYEAYAADSLFAVDNTINLMWDSSFREKQAYMGALLLEKCQLLSNTEDKLSLYREGHERLEEAIKLEPTNAEYRFLRLTVQERLPQMMGYYKNIDEDAAIIMERFEELPIEVERAIIRYSPQSKVLWKLAME